MTRVDAGHSAADSTRSARKIGLFMKLGLRHNITPYIATLCAMLSCTQQVGAQVAIRPATSVAFATAPGKYYQLQV